jgi:hypothetical protein
MKSQTTLYSNNPVGIAVSMPGGNPSQAVMMCVPAEIPTTWMFGTLPVAAS